MLKRIKELVPASTTVSYIPSAQDPGWVNYQTYVAPLFNKLGLTKVEFFGLEPADWQEDYPQKIIQNDLVFLSGGNTYRFLYWLKKRNLKSLLHEISKSKVLMGVSAGSLALTPRIDISSSENEFGLTDISGMNVVDFLIAVHYENSADSTEEVKKYLASLDPNLTPEKAVFDLYTIPDLGGIVINQGQMELFGGVSKFIS